MANQTVQSGTAYCTVAQAVLYHDWRQVADLATDTDVRGNMTSISNSATEDGAKVWAALLSASGEVEEYCQKGERYTPTDLYNLTASGTNMASRLQELVADLAFWRLAKRRWPKKKPEDVSGAEGALKALDRLGSGETIFGFVESAAAGLPAVTSINTFSNGQTVNRARRVFGDVGGCGQWYTGGW